MTFGSVLPHLEAGRRVRRASWPAGVHWYANSQTYVYNDRAAAPLDAHVHLLASDWEVVPEEPAPAKPRGNCPHAHPSEMSCVLSQSDGATGGYVCDCACHVTMRPLRDEVARLTRERDGFREDAAKAEHELALARGDVTTMHAVIAKVTREREEARAELADERKPWTLTHGPGGWSWSRK